MGTTNILLPNPKLLCAYITKALFAAFIFLPFVVSAQFQTNCGPGQKPVSAFPLCGSTVVNQEKLPSCGGRTLESVAGYCSDNVYGDVNGMWYKFTATSNAILGFTITPKDLSNDFDWALFDVTGHNLDEVYSNKNLLVAFNFSENPGVTGATPDGVDLYACAGNSPKVCYEPDITANHNYLLLISRFTNSTDAGFTLNITSGANAIGYATAPKIQKVSASCEANVITVRFSNVTKCSSVALNGSDFTISPANANIVSANPFGCANNSNIDSVIITLDKPLPVGAYTLTAKTGSDGNTILDYCGSGLAVGESSNFTVSADQKPGISLTTNPAQPKQGQPVDIIASVSNSTNAFYQWIVNGVPVWGYTDNHYYAVFNDGDVVQCLLVPNGSGCVAVSNTIVIKIGSLPVNLLYFTGTKQPGSAKLQWKTAQENNSAYYDVLKSINGITFSPIGRVTAAGFSNQPLSYGFTDNDANYASLYYKLKLVDRDGSFKYSNVVAFNSISTNKASIYPNPVTDNNLFVQIPSDKKIQAIVQVYDMQQRLLMQQSCSLRSGNNQLSVQVGNLPTGTYILSIVGENKTVFRFIKN